MTGLRDSLGRGERANRPDRALVMTVVHHPEDARVRHREIGSLLEAGFEVTYAAPFVAH